MRKYLVLAVLSVLLSLPLVAATTVWKNGIHHINYDETKASEVECDKDFTILAELELPEDVIDAYMYYTKCNNVNDTKELRLTILAMGKWESGWSVKKGKKNKDGSRDYGYLMLNDKNIKNKEFMRRYGKKQGDDETAYFSNTLEEKYLIVCINFYKHLFQKYGEDSLYCYNGGEGRYLKNKIPSSTLYYKEIITEYYDEYEGFLISCSNKRTLTERTLMCNVMMNRNTKAYSIGPDGKRTYRNTVKMSINDFMDYHFSDVIITLITYNVVQPDKFLSNDQAVKAIKNALIVFDIDDSYYAKENGGLEKAPVFSNIYHCIIV